MAGDSYELASYGYTVNDFSLNTYYASVCSLCVYSGFLLLFFVFLFL